MCAVLAVGHSASPSPMCLLSQVSGASAHWSSKRSSDTPTPCVVLARLSRIHRRVHRGLALLSHPSPPPRSVGAPSCEQTQLAHLGLISTSRSDSSLSPVGL